MITRYFIVLSNYEVHSASFKTLIISYVSVTKNINRIHIGTASYARLKQLISTFIESMTEEHNIKNYAIS